MIRCTPLTDVVFGARPSASGCARGLKPGLAVPIVQGNRPDLTDPSRMAIVLRTSLPSLDVTSAVQEGTGHAGQQ